MAKKQFLFIVVQLFALTQGIATTNSYQDATDLAMADQKEAEQGLLQRLLSSEAVQLASCLTAGALATAGYLATAGHQGPIALKNLQGFYSKDCDQNSFANRSDTPPGHTPVMLEDNRETSPDPQLVEPSKPEEAASQSGSDGEQSELEDDTPTSCATEKVPNPSKPDHLAELRASNALRAKKGLRSVMLSNPTPPTTAKPEDQPSAPPVQSEGGEDERSETPPEHSAPHVTPPEHTPVALEDNRETSPAPQLLKPSQPEEAPPHSGSDGEQSEPEDDTSTSCSEEQVAPPTTLQRLRQAAAGAGIRATVGAGVGVATTTTYARWHKLSSLRSYLWGNDLQNNTESLYNSPTPTSPEQSLPTKCLATASRYLNQIADFASQHPFATQVIAQATQALYDTATYTSSNVQGAQDPNPLQLVANNVKYYTIPTAIAVQCLLKASRPKPQAVSTTPNLEPAIATKPAENSPALSSATKTVHGRIKDLHKMCQGQSFFCFSKFQLLLNKLSQEEINQSAPQLIDAAAQVLPIHYAAAQQHLINTFTPETIARHIEPLYSLHKDPKSFTALVKKLGTEYASKNAEQLIDAAKSLDWDQEQAQQELINTFTPEAIARHLEPLLSLEQDPETFTVLVSKLGTELASKHTITLAKKATKVSVKHQIHLIKTLLPAEHHKALKILLSSNINNMSLLMLDKNKYAKEVGPWITYIIQQLANKPEQIFENWRAFSILIHKRIYKHLEKISIIHDASEILVHAFYTYNPEVIATAHEYSQRLYTAIKKLRNLDQHIQSCGDNLHAIMTLLLVNSNSISYSSFMSTFELVRTAEYSLGTADKYKMPLVRLLLKRLPQHTLADNFQSILSTILAHKYSESYLFLLELIKAAPMDPVNKFMNDIVLGVQEHTSSGDMKRNIQEKLNVLHTLLKIEKCQSQRNIINKAISDFTKNHFMLLIENMSKNKHTRLVKKVKFENLEDFKYFIMEDLKEKFIKEHCEVLKNIAKRQTSPLNQQALEYLQQTHSSCFKRWPWQ